MSSCGSGFPHGIKTMCNRDSSFLYLPTPNLFSLQGQPHQKHPERSQQNWQYGLEYFLLQMGPRMYFLMTEATHRNKTSGDNIKDCSIVST